MNSFINTILFFQFWDKRFTGFCENSEIDLRGKQTRWWRWL